MTVENIENGINLLFRWCFKWLNFPIYYIVSSWSSPSSCSPTCLFSNLRHYFVIKFSFFWLTKLCSACIVSDRNPSWFIILILMRSASNICLWVEISPCYYFGSWQDTFTYNQDKFLPFLQAFFTEETCC